MVNAGLIRVRRVDLKDLARRNEGISSRNRDSPYFFH